ncbi:SPOR domain-containing protein [Rhodohalobacter sp.]|uniref:SPOR domain-containing protein n=1 Tax=Rhodohalobacter sp. TaxID=1974210 RepID=UPI002ACE029B|nr:SPOR domain-containing protein [Rhodohalobacter sp.]MDZ7755660.1 SPOR domain-containing protein [Rhodohalobacter sp.]
MKTLLSFMGVSILAITLIAGCGPSEEELRQQELERQQAEQDSLEQVYEEQMQQMIQDSIARAEQDSIAEAERQSQIQYSSDGDYAVQVQSWRSEEKANQELEMWKNRGFESAFVVKYGNEETGDVWYRVRIGRVETKEMAENLQDKLSNEYDAQSWISLLN